MSTRTSLRPQHVITNGNMALADITSTPQVMQSLTGVSYLISWSGTSPIGTVSVEVSNDYSINAQGAVDNAGTWVPLELDLAGTPVTTIPITGNTGKGFIDVEKTMAYAIRLIYTRVSGAGTINAVINGKVS